MTKLRELQYFWGAAQALTKSVTSGGFDADAFDDLEVIALNTDWPALAAAATVLLSTYSPLFPVVTLAL